jgi:hypothetical protein
MRKSSHHLNMDVTLGFDPGGAGHFGWAVLEYQSNDTPCLRACGSALHADDAVRAASAELRIDDCVVAAGIDSPMYWTATGDRAAERIVRDAMSARGARNVGGTVQHPNSLRGACVVQGPTTGVLLRTRFPSIPITEAHPKALLWLLGMATVHRQPHNLSPLDFATLFSCSYSCEHERDALLAAWTAYAMSTRRIGWTNLVEREHDPIFIAGEVEYWLPLPS